VTIPDDPLLIALAVAVLLVLVVAVGLLIQRRRREGTVLAVDRGKREPLPRDEDERR
jgi:hypothetical protein